MCRFFVLVPIDLPLLLHHGCLGWLNGKILFKWNNFSRDVTVLTVLHSMLHFKRGKELNSFELELVCENLTNMMITKNWIKK